MLRKNSEFGCVRVELAFRPASKPFFLFESALADDTKTGESEFFRKLFAVPEACP